MTRTIDLSLYPTEAILAAAEDFAGRCRVSISQAGGRRAIVSVEASSVTVLEFWNLALQLSLDGRL